MVNIYKLKKRKTSYFDEYLIYQEKQDDER